MFGRASMDKIKIQELILRLDTTKQLEAEAAWSELKILGASIVPYLAEAYPKFKKWQGRVGLVFHSIKYAKESDAAYKLALDALNDRATLVRYRACGLLAYSQRKEAIPYLKKLLKHDDDKTAADAKAAIYAIKKQNHHYFIDREHTGQIFWEITTIESTAEQTH